MRFKKLFGVMLAIMVGTSMAVLAETAHYVKTGPGVNNWATKVLIMNRGAVTTTCTTTVYQANGTIRVTYNNTAVANGLTTQVIDQATAVTTEMAVVSCDQPVAVWSDVSIVAGAGQGAVEELLEGLTYFQTRLVLGTKGVGQINNTRLVCFNPSPANLTVKFTARDGNGTPLSTSPVNLVINSKTFRDLPIDDPALFGAGVPAVYQGAITIDASSGGVLACVATVDFGSSNQFSFVGMQPLCGTNF